MLLSLITHLNPSSNENLLLAIIDLTRLEMRLGESSIDYMPRVRGIAQRMHRVNIYRIIPLFAIASLDNERYPGVKIRYLVGDTALVNCGLLQLSGLLSSKETRQRALGITAVSPSTTSVNRVSHNNSQNECPVPSQHQPITPSPSMGVSWMCIAMMIIDNKSCPGCHFNHPEDSQNLKFHQEVGFPSLAKHDYIFRKDVTALAKIVYKFNMEFPRNTYPTKVLKPAAKRVSDDSSSNQISARHVHSPSISNSKIESTIPPASINHSDLLMPNSPAPPFTSNGYNDLYSYDSEEDPVFEEMVDSNPIVNTVNT